MRQMLFSGMARALGFIPQGIAVLVASNLIIHHFGLHAFNTYALIISVMTLIPLNNLGVGASVTQTISAYGSEDERAERSALTASRVLAMSGLGLAIASTVIGMVGLWPTLLGDASGANAFTAIALVIFALGFVPGLGQSVLLAVERNHISITVLSFQAPISLVAVVVLILFHADARAVVLVPAVSWFLVNAITMALSGRLARFPWLRILKQVPWRSRYPGIRIRSLSGPMLVTSLCVPLAFAGDRIVLSHVSTQEAVGNYSVVIQIFSPVMGLIVAVSQPLWPMFTQARSQGERGPRLGRIFLAFGVGTFLVSGTLVLISDRIGTIIGGDQINLGYFLPVTAALVTCLLAVTYPLAMSMVDPAGARFVAICAVITLPTNIAMSIWLSEVLGAPGPLVSLLIVSLLVQVIPTLIYSIRRERAPELIQI